MNFRDPEYCPGGRNEEAQRRVRARAGGLASGRARRRMSTVRRQEQPRHGQQPLPIAYRVHQVTVAEFTDRYRVMCDERGITYDLRGLRTALELYRCHLTVHRARNELDFETTNDQVCRALAKRGRARCRRTVQRQRKRLEWMGLINYHHIRRSGHRRIPGQLDSLRVRCMPLPCRANVTPPSGAREPSLREGGSLAATAKSKALPALIAPPSAAEDDPPASPENGAPTKRTERQQRIWWLQLKLEHWPESLGDRDRHELNRLIAEEDRSGQGTAWTASIAWEGER